MMSLVRSDNFFDVPCDFYKDRIGEIYLTREQIGTALGYANPVKAIQKIHLEHKDRLDRLSCREKSQTIKPAKTGDSHDHPQNGGAREDVVNTGFPGDDSSVANEESLKTEDSHEPYQIDTGREDGVNTGFSKDDASVVKEEPLKTLNSHERGQSDPGREDADFTRPQNKHLQSETVYYSERGIMEICRWSDMPKADEFMDWCFDIVEAYRHGQLIAMNTQIADLIEKVGVITDQFNAINNQLEATQTRVAVMQKEVETMQNDQAVLSETSSKLDNRLAMVESGVSVSNGKLSKWVQETSKDVLELAEADGCKPKEMYSKIINEMCEVGGYNWEEIYKQYCECHPDEKSPWRIVVIEYFNLCEQFEDALVRLGYDILPSKYERPTYGMGSDWMVGCEF